MKRILLTFFIALGLTPMSQAQTYEKLWGVFNSGNHTLTLMAANDQPDTDAYEFTPVPLQNWGDLNTQLVHKVVVDESCLHFTGQSLKCLFHNFLYMQSIKNLDNLSTFHVTTMEQMFFNCQNLEEVDLSHFNTTNVENMDGMFYDCHALRFLDLGSFSTQHLQSMKEMFWNCISLETVVVDANLWQPTAEVDGTNMFYNCKKLVGGYRTAYSSIHTDATYARIDAPGTPGYFVSREAQSVDLSDSTGSYYWLTYLKDQKLDVTLSGRTLYRDGRWQTLCLPFSLSSTELNSSPLAGAEVRSLQSASLDDGTLTLSFQSVSEIVAGTPYLVRWNEPMDDVTDPVFRDAVIAENTPSIVNKSVVEFVGVFRPVTLSAGNQNLLYLGGDNRLYYPTADVTVNAFRAYLLLHPAAGAAPVQRYVLSIDDNDIVVGSTSGLSSPIAELADCPAYSLGGILKSANSSGLRIVGGRKYLIK